MTKRGITTISSEKLREMVDRTRDDAPEAPPLDDEFWANARVVYPDTPKKQLTVRLDADVVEWFRLQGKGYQTRMNAVLRSYYEAARRQQVAPTDER